MGGLGNQMFQYAYGKYLSQNLQEELILDISFYLPGNQDPGLIREYDLHIFKNIKCQTTTSNTNGTEGFFQRHDFVTEIRELLLKDFEVTVDSDHIEILNEIDSLNSVCLNVRRADYVHYNKSAGFHGFIGNDYFEAVVTELSKELKDPHFFVFSDDIQWCKENIKTGFPTKFMTKEYHGPKYSTYLKLMSKCKHFILPNSTFGWWAAWMSDNPEKIIYAPKKWFIASNEPEGLIPNNWRRK